MCSLPFLLPHPWQLTTHPAVSENKVLTHPSSVDSITTSAGTEDHVSMGGYAARKALTIVEHVETGKREGGGTWEGREGRGHTCSLRGEGRGTW